MTNAQSAARLARRRTPIFDFFCDCRGRRRPQKDGCHVVLTEDKIEKPDLAIYSQLERLQAGDSPSWDSPDITTNNWRPFRLLDEARVRVRNLSPDTPATNALVHYYVAPFGIGMPRELKASKRISLPANSQTELLFPLEASVLEGDPRVGVFIEIEHPHDTNKINNAGAQVHQGEYTTEAGRNHFIDIPVLNDTNFERRMNFAILPTDLTAGLSLTTHRFAPFEQISLRLQIEVPAAITGAPDNVQNRSVTVVARDVGGDLVGGVTRLLRIDN